MGFASLAALGTVVLLLCVLAVGLSVLLLRSRSATRRDLGVARAETAELRGRLEELAAHLEQQASAVADAAPAAYVITDAGATTPERVAVSDRVVLSATLGEPLVKAAALGHGLRRALTAETRNRIRSEMRREIRSSRRRRRRDERAFAREARAARRAADAPDAA